MRLVVVVTLADGVGQDLVHRQVERVADLGPEVPGCAELVDPRRDASELPQIVDERDFQGVVVQDSSSLSQPERAGYSSRMERWKKSVTGLAR